MSARAAATLFADLAALPAVVLAVSGGPDSTALLVLAARWRAALGAGPRLVAATVDHGLRPGSSDEALAVGRLAGVRSAEAASVVSCPSRSSGFAAPA
ncbi:ATP-binding protein, partial [Rhodoplanes serenus]|uniref:ATP-binding protein n=1 Tax=Rhodoplanes serenus TaxID=200615 RepID=UPI000DBBC1B3